MTIILNRKETVCTECGRCINSEEEKELVYDTATKVNEADGNGLFSGLRVGLLLHNTIIP